MSKGGIDNGSFTPEDRLRLKLFRRAYDISHEPDPTVRFARAIVLSSGPINYEALEAYQTATEAAQGMEGNDRTKVFAAACATVNIRKRLAWAVDDEPLKLIGKEA